LQEEEEKRLNEEEEERLKAFNLEKTKRENQIKKEKQLLEKIDQTYKEELEKEEQEKLIQLEEVTKLKEKRIAEEQQEKEKLDQLHREKIVKEKQKFENLHSFLWLTKLDRINSKIITKGIITSWINTFFNYDPNTWEMEITAKRIIAWSSNTDITLENSDKIYKEKFFLSLIKQSNFLSKNLKNLFINFILFCFIYFEASEGSIPIILLKFFG